MSVYACRLFSDNGTKTKDFLAKEARINQGLIDEAIATATRIAADRVIDLDQAELKHAVLAIVGACDGQDEP